MPKMSRKSKGKKTPSRRAARPAAVRRPGSAGVPRHNFAVAKQAVVPGHVDATKDSVTAFLQPFEAYQRRLSPGLPVYGQNIATYGFWTRNVIVTTDVALGASASVGTQVRVVPRLGVQILAATVMDINGVPSAFQPYDDPFKASCIVNFDSVVCAYQGFRIKNLTAVLGQAGEALVSRTPDDDLNSTYAVMRAGGNTFAKSAADPGVLLTLNFEGTSGQVPSVVGNIVDYGWHPPSQIQTDGQSTVMSFRSTAPSAQPQTWEVEVVTYYLARPFSTVAAFFTPIKREVDMTAFDRALDRALAKSPELSIARNALPDDGVSTTIMEDLSSIWGGVQAAGRVASAAWSGLTSLFGLAEHRRHAVILSMFENQQQYEAFLSAMQGRDLAAAVAAAVPPPPPEFTPAQISSLRRLILEEEKNAKEDFDCVTHLSARDVPPLTPLRRR